ncbi:MAG: hypothetical protein GKR97_10750 [Rhizobiaceae bacterium]|nr:hypothetical protein [Rhizobiaceae bacterium]
MIPPRCTSARTAGALSAGPGFNNITGSVGVGLWKVEGSIGDKLSSCTNEAYPSAGISALHFNNGNLCSSGGQFILMNPLGHGGQTYNFKQTFTGEGDGITYVINTVFQLISDKDPYPSTHVVKSMTIEGGVFGAADEHPLTVQFTGPGSGSITGSPGSLSCSTANGPCSANITNGSDVILTAIADSGSTFDGWEGTCDAVQNDESCVQTVNDAETVTAKFIEGPDSAFVVEHTQKVIRNFMADRLDQIASGDVSLAQRLINRSGRFDLPVNVNGFQLISAGLHELGVRGAGINPLQSASVETSLHQMLSYQHQQQQAHTAAFDPILPTPGGADADPGENTIASRFDIWLNARYARVLNEDRSGDFGLIYLGADYLVSPAVLIGGLVQIDLFDQKDDELNAKTKGTGWLAGPYVVARINEKLLFEGRAAWGMSDNEVDPFGIYTDEFETRRWLVKGALTGDFAGNGWRFNPAVSAFWIQDSQQQYVDTLGFTIPDQSVDLGQLSFGSTLSRVVNRPGGLTVTPSLQVEGVWNFRPAEQGSSGGASTSQIRARAKTGLSVTGPTGLTINASGHLDGIGIDDLLSYGGEVQISIPLQ